MALPAPAVGDEIRIALQRAGTTVKILWPVARGSALRGLAAVASPQTEEHRSVELRSSVSTGAMKLTAVATEMK